MSRITALETACRIRQHEMTAMDAVEQFAAAIAETDAAYHCFVSLDKEAALRQAEQVQRHLDAGESLSPLAGVPIAIKDNICEKGKLTTCASKMLSGFRPPYDATVITRLKEAGMVPLGKTNMDEFAMGSTTETSVYGGVRNPWDARRVAGGSSGGAAAAVALGESVAALGSDTGGSVRLPCSYCGVTGLKPTYGAVSRYGLIAYASSLDQIGPIAQTVEDVAAIFNIIKGRDERDATSAAVADVALQAADLKGKKVGVLQEFLTDQTDDEVVQCVQRTAAELKALGAETEALSLPLTEYAVPTYYIIACAEASANLARYDGVRYGYRADGAATTEELFTKSRSEAFGAEVKKRIMLGNFVLSAGYYEAYYQKALQVKNRICQAFNNIFKQYDFLLAPVAPSVAPMWGEGLQHPWQMCMGDRYNVMVNLAGLPALALPCGFTQSGLPIGCQLIGKPFDEQGILTAGAAFQRVTDYHFQTPTGRDER